MSHPHEGVADVVLEAQWLNWQALEPGKQSNALCYTHAIICPNICICSMQGCDAAMCQSVCMSLPLENMLPFNSDSAQGDGCVVSSHYLHTLSNIQMRLNAMMLLLSPIMLMGSSRGRRKNCQASLSQPGLSPARLIVIITGEEEVYMTDFEG